MNKMNRVCIDYKDGSNGMWIEVLDSEIERIKDILEHDEPAKEPETMTLTLKQEIQRAVPMLAGNDGVIPNIMAIIEKHYPKEIKVGDIISSHSFGLRVGTVTGTTSSSFVCDWRWHIDKDFAKHANPEEIECYNKAMEDK